MALNMTLKIHSKLNKLNLLSHVELIGDICTPFLLSATLELCHV